MPTLLSTKSCLRFILLTLICCCISVLTAPAHATSEAEELDLIRQRLLTEYLKGPTSQAPKWLAALDAEGRWADVKYEDASRAAWQPMQHLERVTIMATAWRKGGSKDAAMMDGIQRALQYWYQRNLQSANWWFNTIGAPHQLMRILTLTEGALPADLFKSGISRLKDPGQVPISVATGQNLVWHAAEQVVRGVLKASPDDVASASRSIQSEIRITEDEGIQPDFSFHQHGPQLYNGGYGIGFIEDGSYYASLLADTRWAFSPQVITLLGNYMLEGQRPMVRRTWFDFSARAREPTRSNAYDAARKLIVPARQLSVLLPERATELEAFAQHIEGKGSSAAFIGNRHFWRSDFMTHQRPGWHASVRMLSRRTAGAEVVNSENLTGFWAPLGMTYLVRDAEEYRDILPVWNWNRLPGTTAPDARGTVRRGAGMNVDAVLTSERFVGGVSDGQVGAAAMVLDIFDTEAHKAWFLFDQAIVALGAGIRSTRPEMVATTLNQTRLRGPIIVDGNPPPMGDIPLPGAHWVWHDGFGYFFPEGGDVRLQSLDQSGSWSRINAMYKPETLTQPVFTLMLEHGVKPKDARYAYIVLPDTNAQAVAAFAAKPTLRILANTPRLQAVRDEANGVTQIVFYEAGSLTLPEGEQISVDEPCLLMLRDKDSARQITASNPLAKSLRLNLTYSGARAFTMRFNLPGDENAGRSVTLNPETAPRP